jgi:large subunit ribosomal protein L10
MREAIKKKQEEVERILEISRGFNNIIISNIEKIPANKMREIRKKFKDILKMKMMKSRLIKRVLEAKGINVDEAKDVLKKPSILIFTNEDIFHVASLFEEDKEYTYIKPGQIAEEDIIIAKGPTTLLPIHIADLSKAGLKVGVERGKVVIKEDYVIKKGEAISSELADALQKLDIKPIPIGLAVNFAVDLKNKKIYKNVLIDKRKEIENIKIAYSYAINLAMNINYLTNKTALGIIKKAYTNAYKLNKALEK